MACGPQRNETTQDKLILNDELHDNILFRSKQCHNWMCTTLYSKKNVNNDDNDKNNNNENNGL